MEDKHENFIAVVRKREMIAASKMKMSGSDKIQVNMNTGNKTFGQHIRQFLHKNKKRLVVVQNNGKERQKSHVQIVLLIRKIESVLHVQICLVLVFCFFCWLDLLILMPFSLPYPFSITRFNFCCCL